MAKIAAAMPYSKLESSLEMTATTRRPVPGTVSGLAESPSTVGMAPSSSRLESYNRLSGLGNGSAPGASGGMA